MPWWPWAVAVAVAVVMYRRDLEGVIDMSRHPKLADVDPEIRGDVSAILAQLESEGWQPRIYSAHRTPGEQASKLDSGASTVAVSYHMHVTPGGRPAALAVDVADRRYGWGSKPYDAGNPKAEGAARFFARLGQLAKARGMRWGGDWTGRAGAWSAWGIGWDPAHIEVGAPRTLAGVRSRLRDAGVLV